VTTIDSATTTRRRSAVKIVGALSAVGAAVAVAGMGTFGNFTDSTSPVGTKVDTGVLSVDVSQPGGAAVPFSGGMMLAGDSRSAVIDLVNDGTTALSAVTIKSWATSSSILDQDTVNGLQLTVESCSVAWNTAGASPTCPGTVRSYFTQPIIVTDYPLNFSAATAAGATDHLKLTAALPTGASGDAFEGASSDLKFQFTGIQRSGGVR
jgi:predicted ribosomally synthesized peptide with SipW-like signal peptide